MFEIGEIRNSSVSKKQKKKIPMFGKPKIRNSNVWKSQK